MHMTSFRKHPIQNSELSASIMVRRSSHYDHPFRNVSQFCDRICCNNHFVRIPYRTNLLLVEDITRNANNVRFLFLGYLNHIFKTFYCVLQTEIYSVHYRSFKLANMPVSSMKYFHLLISFTVAFIAVIMFFNSVSKSEKFSSLIPQNSTPSSPIFSPIKRIFPTMGHPCLSNS